MFGHIAEPFDAGGLQGGVRVQTFGDGVGDDGLAFLFQQFNQPPLLPPTPSIFNVSRSRKRRDHGLLVVRWKSGAFVKVLLLIEILDS